MDQQNSLGAAVGSMIEAAELARVNRDELLARMASLFTRREPRLQAGRYVDGLLSDLPRKNGWTLAEHAGDATPDRMRRLLDHAVWDETAAMGVVATFVVEHLADEFAVAVLDESGQEKAGAQTAGVKRQHVGCAGKVANAINVVYATYAAPRGHALVGARLYLPKDWASDPDRRARAGVPDAVTFKTKPALALDLLTDLEAAGRLAPWITADEVYGRDPTLRAFCEHPDRNLGYVLEVPCSFRFDLPHRGKPRADRAARLVPADGWNHRCAGPGSKGERTYAWAWIATTSPRHHLLIRRSLSDPTELAYFHTHAPEGRPVTLPTLVRVAGMRWPVEEDFRTGKVHFGLDHSQVRLYHALTRHIVLAMTAPAIGAITAAAVRSRTSTLAAAPTGPYDAPPEDPGLIPLTIAETNRICNLLSRAWHTITHHLNWTHRRRRHQARARWFHQRARLRRATNGP